MHPSACDYVLVRTLPLVSFGSSRPALCLVAYRGDVPRIFVCVWFDLLYSLFLHCCASVDMMLIDTAHRVVHLQ